MRIGIEIQVARHYHIDRRINIETKNFILEENMEAASRGSFWSDDEVLLLINIWADEKIQQQLDSCMKDPL